MLDTGASVVIDVLLDLALLQSVRWLVDWHLEVRQNDCVNKKQNNVCVHLDCFLVVGYDDGAKGRVLSVDLRVVHRPETMKHQASRVPVYQILLITLFFFHFRNLFTIQRRIPSANPAGYRRRDRQSSDGKGALNN